MTGPYTGLELRTAASAYLILPDTRIARTADGPWTRAADIGLFLDKNVPLPNLPQPALPAFRLTRVNEALEGPFELQELIDFAVRKILPREAEVQPLGHLDRIPVSQFRILDACLSGKLYRDPTPAKPHSDESSVVAPPPVGSPPVAPNTPPHDGAQLPVTLSVQHADLMTEPEDDLELILSDYREQLRRDFRERSANRSAPLFKVAYAGWAVMLLVVSVWVWWIMQPSPLRTDRNEVIGNWGLIPSQEKAAAFGISFKEDGTCVVFNSDGDCWSGDFQWFDDAASEARIRSLSPTQGKDIDIPSHHYRFAVQDSDGYVRLEGGSLRKPPMLGTQPIRECFLRQDDSYLWMGYLINVDPTSDNPSLDVGWVSLWPCNPAASFGTLDKDTWGTNLLARYGVPDEARPLDPLEVTANSDPKLAEPRSLVRYGETRLTLFADSSVRRFKAPDKSNATSNAGRLDQ